MVREALQRDLVQELYCDEKEEQALAKELAKLQKRPVIEVLKTTLFKQMSDTVNPQGVLAVITMPSYDREQMISSSECKLLCLENIQDPGTQYIFSYFHLFTIFLTVYRSTAGHITGTFPICIATKGSQNFL